MECDCKAKGVGAMGSRKGQWGAGRSSGEQGAAAGSREGCNMSKWTLYTVISCNTMELSFSFSAK
jgi:hypothetical protein